MSPIPGGTRSETPQGFKNDPNTYGLLRGSSDSVPWIRPLIDINESPRDDENLVCCLQKKVVNKYLGCQVQGYVWVKGVERESKTTSITTLKTTQRRIEHGERGVVRSGSKILVPPLWLANERSFLSSFGYLYHDIKVWPWNKVNRCKNKESTDWNPLRSEWDEQKYRDVSGRDVWRIGLGWVEKGEPVDGPTNDPYKTIIRPFL